MDVAGGGWILIGRIGDLAETDGEPFDRDVDVAGLLAFGEPEERQYSHFDTARFDAFGAEWTVMVQVDIRRGLAPMPDIERFTFFRAREGMAVSPSDVGRDWHATQLEHELEHLTASKVDHHWQGGRTNATWLPSDGDQPDWPFVGFHLMGHVDQRFPEFGDGVTLTPDCVDERDQTQDCHQTAGMLDADPNGNRRGTSSGSAYRDGGSIAEDGLSAHYWIRDDRVEQPQAQ